MNAMSRRGACPTLSAPMQTGDGLLARLNPVAGGLSPKALIGLCESAQRHGSGIVEVTARGSLQIRGLTPSSANRLAREVDELGIAVRSGVPVETGPLAGIDPSEVVDPSPLGDRIRADITAVGLAERLGPKVSVVVDGGGRLALDAFIADVRLVAQRHSDETVWQLATGGDAATAMQHGFVSGDAACDAVIAILQAIGELGKEARARDLDATRISETIAHLDGREHQPNRITRVIHQSPLSAIPLSNGTLALAIALPFGSTPAGALIDLARAALAEGVTDIRPAPARALLFPGLGHDAFHRLREAAVTLGFVTDASDPRLYIAACPGAPACASGKVETRAIAEHIAATQADLLDGTFTLHVSGCSKGCAHPAPAALAVVGCDWGAGLVVNEKASALTPDSASCNDARRGLAHIADLVQTSRRPTETAAASLARLGSIAIETAYRQE
ncbi:cobalamin biosynthesis protein CobG [Mesorhizobium sp. Root157]|uniref:precorrin-3B synthase n=1 Tax=Mesorhizobium sp. Root157 TaxID=1736477 RepID=UPI0006FC08CC|nr:precorrin-3B synthase [Mesorhizobium sp. Root157]KQZ81830.1 cobalamin biosynthesis protein CobG [Mesorhizobium sp. Root157]